MPRRPAVPEAAATHAAASNLAKAGAAANRPLRPLKPAPRRSFTPSDSAAVSAELEAPSQGGAAAPLGAALLDVAHAARDALALKDPVAAIHKTRRALKQARALLLLVGGEHRHAAWQLRRDLGAAAHSLASTRDRHIIHDAIAELTSPKRSNPLDDTLARKIVGSLAAHEPAHINGAQGGLSALREAKLAERMAAALHLAGEMDVADLPKALATGYRRARRAARGLDRDDAEALHELRKHVVAHVSQMELAVPWWPRLGEIWLDELQRLRELLGRHHDLEILLTRLDEAPGRLAPQQIAIAMDAASRRQRRLAGKALRRHAQLFAERPKAFRRRLAVYLEACMDCAEDRE